MKVGDEEENNIFSLTNVEQVVVEITYNLAAIGTHILQEKEARNIKYGDKAEKQTRVPKLI